MSIAKGGNMSWIIIINSKILLCLTLEYGLLPASKMPITAATWPLPSPLTLTTSSGLELGWVEEGQGGIKSAMITRLIPYFEVTMKLGWLCNDAHGNLWVAFRVHPSICCTQHTDGVCKIFYPPLCNHCLTSSPSIHSTLPHHQILLILALRKISLLSYGPHILPNCFYLQLL